VICSNASILTPTTNDNPIIKERSPNWFKNVFMVMVTWLSPRESLFSKALLGIFIQLTLSKESESSFLSIS